MVFRTAPVYYQYNRQSFHQPKVDSTINFCFAQLVSNLPVAHTFLLMLLGLHFTLDHTLVLTQYPIFTESVDIPLVGLSLLTYALVGFEPTVHKAILGPFC